MLPPPPPTALCETNPHFSLLYDHLIKNTLNHDGSTRSAAVEHDTVAKKLGATRKVALRYELLLFALEETVLANGPLQPSQEPMSARTRATSQNQQDKAPARLSPELQHLVLNIISYLSVSLDPEISSSLPPDTNELMAEELERFHDHLPEISKHLSRHLINSESDLATLASALVSRSTTPSLPPSNSSTAIRYNNTTSPITPKLTLSESLTSLTTSTTTIQGTTLPALLNTTTQNLSTLLATHVQQLHRTIRALELTTHGTSARHLTARSTYLNAVSRGIELKAQTLRLERERALYADEALLDTLAEEYDALQSQERRLAKRERDLRALLDEYESAGREAVLRSSAMSGHQQQEPAMGSGEDVFRALGERYAEIECELDVVKADVERLEEVWLRPRESRAG